MHYVKPRNDLIFIANPLIFLTGLLLFWHYAEWIPSAFYAFWITTVLALLFILTPWGSIYLSQHHDEVAKRVAPLSWLFRIFVLELALLGSYSGICLISGQLLPVMSSTHTDLFQQYLRSMTHVGLFPWPLYAIITVGMCILAYRQQTHAYCSNLLKPFLNQHPQEALSLMINVGARRCAMFVFSITLLFFAFLELSVLLSLKKHLVIGFQTPALLTTLMLMLFSTFKTVKHYENRFFSRKISTLISFPIFGLVLGIAILITNLLLMSTLQQNSTPVQMPAIVKNIVNMDWDTSWIIFSGLWWLCLTPAVCSYLADISKGYRIREVIIGILILPLFIGIFVLFFYDPVMQWLTPSTEFSKIIALIGFFVLLPLLLNHKTSGNVIVSYFPKDGIVKHRDHQSFFQRMIQLSVFSLYFYFILGINGLSLFFFSLTYFFLIILIVISIAISKNIIDSKV